MTKTRNLLVFMLLFSTSCQQVAFREMDASPATFDVKENSLFLSGVIYSKTPHHLKKLIHDYPKLTTVVFGDVPGSISDSRNLKTGRLIRKHKLTTVLTDRSVIASGGVDLFLSGCKRIIHEKARIGVHSWSGGKKTATTLPRQHKEHRKYLEYYRQMNVDTSFYWFTLQAAPADSIYWMNEREIKQYGMDLPGCQ